MLADLLSTLFANATGVEAFAALVGVAGALYAVLAVLDDVYDLRLLGREAETEDPRWHTARGHLLFNLCLLFAWLGYMHVAVIAAYLPPRPDMGSSGLVAQVAAMRVVYALLLLSAQVTLRWSRLRLRGLPREAWAPMFGDAERWQRRFLTEHGKVAALKSEVHTLRAERHDREQRVTALILADQVNRRIAERHGITLPGKPAVVEGE